MNHILFYISILNIFLFLLQVITFALCCFLTFPVKINERKRNISKAQQVPGLHWITLKTWFIHISGFIQKWIHLQMDHEKLKLHICLSWGKSKWNEWFADIKTVFLQWRWKSMRFLFCLFCSSQMSYWQKVNKLHPVLLKTD